MAKNKTGSTNNGAQSAVSPDLLEILRDPQAIQEGAKHGADPGRLELVRGAWLVSADTGYKYPIRDGIPVMLIEEGARWKDTAVADLPVPPPPAEPPPAVERAADPLAPATAGPDFRILLAAGALVFFLLLLIGLTRRRPQVELKQPTGA
jgi:uncharacterized protein YbaR (Trm112 family)